MEFKTTTGGLTTLVLDPSEEAWLRGVAKARKQHYEDALKEFEQVRRSNPLADFAEVAQLFVPNAKVNGITAPDEGANGLEDLIELDAYIRKEIRECSSLQVRALLLQARATTLHAIAVIQTLRGLDE